MRYYPGECKNDYKSLNKMWDKKSKIIAILNIIIPTKIILEISC